MNKISKFIVEKKWLIFIIVLAITIFCAILIPKVKVNYDMSKYLPQDSEVFKGLDIMEDNFELIDSLQIMIKNIEKEKTNQIFQNLKEIEGIKSIEFDINKNTSYKNNNALFSITLANKSSQEVKTIVENIKTELKEYDISLSGSAISSQNMTNTLKKEMPIFLIVALVLILIILLLISTSWLEPLLFLSISAISIIINYGTNIIFNEISFVTFAIAALLQLALSMDYSIMLLDQYHHESKEKEKKEAMIAAWKKSFNAIFASSLTTVFGLLAMLFMSFTIGRDLGIVLAKGILINVLVVLLALPTLILISEKWLNKTKKKSIHIPIKLLSKTALKGKYIISLIMIVITLVAFFIQSNLKFSYSITTNNEETKEIEKEFGNRNQLIVLYKTDEQNNIEPILEFVQNYQIDGKENQTNIIDYHNTVALPLSSQEVSTLSGMDSTMVNKIYQMYNMTNQTKEEKIELNKLLEFIEQNILTNKEYQSLINEQTKQTLEIVKKQLEENEELLKKENYNRMIININTEIESEDAHEFYKQLQEITDKNLKEKYVLGETALASSIEKSFANETLWITIITIISMILVIAFIYKSIGLPLILVTLIQGAIWISLCYPVVTNNSLFFLAYIIVQCIQMGATIDYAILLSSNYMNNREKQTKQEAIKNALKASVMTIFTSATILIVATFTIAMISSQEMISTICMVIGRGTLISAIIVLLVLPACLVISDLFLEKTSYKKKFLKETDIK